MKEKGFVIDHMDNDKHNCCIDNFCFLKNSYNKAKGLTFDQENVDKRYIALSIYKDWETELFQIAIFFNYPQRCVRVILISRQWLSLHTYYMRATIET